MSPVLYPGPVERRIGSCSRFIHENLAIVGAELMMAGRD